MVHTKHTKHTVSWTLRLPYDVCRDILRRWFFPCVLNELRQRIPVRDSYLVTHLSSWGAFTFVETRAIAPSVIQRLNRIRTREPRDIGLELNLMYSADLERVYND